MCSNKCAKPLRPFCSLRDPTSYTTETPTVGDVLSTFITSRRPLSRLRFSTPSANWTSATGAGEGGAGGGALAALELLLESALAWPDFGFLSFGFLPSLGFLCAGPAVLLGFWARAGSEA